MKAKKLKRKIKKIMNRKIAAVLKQYYRNMCYEYFPGIEDNSYPCFFGTDDYYDVGMYGI